MIHLSGTKEHSRVYDDLRESVSFSRGKVCWVKKVIIR